MGSHNELVVVGLNEQLLCSAYYVGCQRDDAALAAERRRLQLSTDISSRNVLRSKPAAAVVDRMNGYI